MVGVDGDAAELDDWHSRFERCVSQAAPDIEFDGLLQIGVGDRLPLFILDLGKVIPDGHLEAVMVDV